jgi:hypothetical protein
MADQASPMRTTSLLAASTVLSVSAMLLNCTVIEVQPPAAQATVPPASEPEEDSTDGGAKDEPQGAADASAAETSDAAPPTDTEAGQVVIDLGTVKAGDTIPVTIPSGALGFNITGEGTLSAFDPQRPFGIERIVAPNGTVVHDNFTPTGGNQATSTAAFDVIAAASVPQAQNVPTSLGGTWKLQFGVANGTAKPNLKAKVLVQSTADGAFHGGRLDLHIHVPPGLKIGNRTVNPASAATDPGIKERLDTFFAVTTQLLGITRGNVEFSTAGAQYARLDGVEQWQDGFAISAGEADETQVLHILLTNFIGIDGQNVAVGVSPGIPGAANRFGRGVSGLLVAFTEKPVYDALTIVHEMGHFIGLNHTTEFSGDASDPLSETPVCPGIGRTQEQLVGCPDRKNIMFPAGAIEGPVELSPTQKRAYRGSPIYKANPTGTATMSSLVPIRPLPPISSMVRLSQGTRLSPVESVLAMGRCGLTPIHADELVARFGREAAIAQLRAAAADTDLMPFIRGRATLALKRLGVR